MTIAYKTGRLQDCGQIADRINSVGHGHIEYLLDALVPGRTALEQLALVLGEDQHYSYKNVDLAADGDRIVGLVFSYSSYANAITPEMQNILSDDRVQWVRYFSDNQVDNSWYINTLDVDEAYRRQGIASQLLDYAAHRALQNQIQCLSLHVYENNLAAIKLYETYGFTEVRRIDLTAHEFFRTRNLAANILMKCKVTEIEFGTKK
jgi:ribosomal protein S18 acetylase RimI-like enzyme